MHGQWDWMNDPEIHSSTWEWDNTDPSAHWKQTHNYIHHKYTNVLGIDDDIGYGLLRVTRDQRVEAVPPRQSALQPAAAARFRVRRRPAASANSARWPRGASTRSSSSSASSEVLAEGRQADRQGLRDLPGAHRSRLEDARSPPTSTANVIRNVWTNMVIFCGHFPDGAEKFTKADIDGETQGQWYLRQMLGSANIEGGPLMDFMTGNLSHQIEHHLFPDLPSNRYRGDRGAGAAAGRQVRPAVHDRARSSCSTASRGAPSSSCRCRTSTSSDTSDDAPETHRSACSVETPRRRSIR